MSQRAPLTRSRAAGFVLLLAAAAYVNALGNGFAYDDNLVIVRNPVVTEARWDQALFDRYWPDAREGSGLYRPTTVTAFAAQWSLWGERPLPFHAVSLALHAAVSLLVLALLLPHAPLHAAAAGAVVFALHPVHVEAVANVVGQAELLAALSVLLACLVFERGRAWSGSARGLRLGVVAGLYLVGLGAKEIAVTLPALLLLLALYPAERAERASRLRDALGMAVPLVAVLAAYLVVRWSVLGTVAGEVPAPALRGLDGRERVLTALGQWPQYLRLMVWPASLSADYAPGVLDVARTVTPAVLAGAAVLVGWVAGAVLLLRRAPLVSLGLAWFLVAVLPVSNLLIPSGVLVAERTLYLPSVGLAFVGAGAVAAIPGTAPARTRRLAVTLAMVAGILLLVRTVTRNPTWMSSYSMLNTLALEHPESYMALQHRAAGLDRVGEVEDAARAYDAAVELAPRHYGLLVEAGGFHARQRNESRAESLLRRAVAETPGQPTAYRLLSEQLIRLGRAREGHAVALEGLARAGPDRELWALVSESYIAKGDLEASARARRAALAQDPGSAHDWGRLADVLEALGRGEEAGTARARARALSVDGAHGP